MFYNDIKNNREYTAQIFPSDGKVWVEILYANASEQNELVKKFTTSTFYAVAVRKSFGYMFRSAPRERDYIKAKHWANKQLSLLEKYATGIITKPQFLKDKEMIEVLKKMDDN